MGGEGCRQHHVPVGIEHPHGTDVAQPERDIPAPGHGPGADVERSERLDRSFVGLDLGFVSAGLESKVRENVPYERRLTAVAPAKSRASIPNGIADAASSGSVGAVSSAGGGVPFLLGSPVHEKTSMPRPMSDATR